MHVRQSELLARASNLAEKLGGEGHDVETIKKFFDRARVGMSNIGPIWSDLEQIARFGDHPEAQKFARALSEKLYEMSHSIAEYLHDNPTLDRKPPSV